MMLLATIALLALSGLVIGGLARLALPGPDPIGVVATVLVGLAGAAIGGLATLLLTGGRTAGGLLAAVGAATVFVYLARRQRGGSLFDPGHLDR